MLLKKQPPNYFTGCSARFLQDISLALHHDDGMYQGDGDLHYLTCGASAINVITAAADLARIRPRSILDFGAGAGRVTRWLRAAYPEAKIFATDLRSSDMEFCAREFRASSWVSGTDIDGLASPSQYDLIWVGSVITHLSAADSERLLRRLLSWLRPNGVLVASFHGRFARHRGPEFDFYGVGQAWPALEGGYAEAGFGYADYPGQTGYGISLTRLGWVAWLSERLEDTRLVLLSERVWDDHHDVLALQRRSIAAALSSPGLL